MTDIINKVSIDVFPYDWFHISTSEDWGRTKINITVNSQLIDAVDWVKRYREQLEEESKIRSENPAVSMAY